MAPRVSKETWKLVDLLHQDFLYFEVGLTTGGLLDTATISSGAAIAALATAPVGLLMAVRLHSHFIGSPPYHRDGTGQRQ